VALSKTKIKRRTNAYHNYKTLVARISYKCMMLGIEHAKVMDGFKSAEATNTSGYSHSLTVAAQEINHKLFRLQLIQGRRRIVNAGKIKAAISQY